MAASVPSTTKLFAKESLARLTPSAGERIPKIAKTACAARSQRRKFLEVFVGHLVKEEAEGKNDGARDDPIDVAPKHWRLVEERAKGRASSQQPDGVKNAQQAKINQRQIACPAAKTEKSDCSEGDRQNDDGGRNNREFPA